MKTFNNKIYMLMMLGIASITLHSCTKSFDEKDYEPPFTVNGFSYVRDIRPSNLVGYWAFENSVYDSVQKVAGTSTNVSYKEGFVGQALQGANNGYAVSSVGDKINKLNDYTISFWMKYPGNVANNGSGVTILSLDADNYDGNNPMQTGSWDFYKNPWGIDPTNATASYFGAKVRNVNGVSNYWDKTAYLNNLWTKNIFDNWVQWTFTYDSATTTFNIYLNGIQWKSDGFVDTGGGSNIYPLNFPSMGNIILDNPKNIIFGANTAQGQAGGVAGYPGLLDEVRVYNTALNASQVQALVALQIKGRL